MKTQKKKKNLWGMVHVRALPGTPHDEKNFDDVVKKAVKEAQVLESLGCSGILFENMHDVPYLKSQVGPEITAAMAAVGIEIRNETKLSLGVQILAGANEAALSVAHAVGAEWIRVEGFVFSHVADEGWIEACAGPLLRLRRELGATGIKIMADIKKKHSSHAVTSDVSIVEMAKAAEFFGADAVVLTGASTGEMASAEELLRVQSAIALPVLIGSGITAQNAFQYASASGFIVGSSLKKNGNWKNELDPDAAQQVVRALEVL